MIKTKEIKTFVDYLFCDECGGYMKFTGDLSGSVSRCYKHKCINCGHFDYIEDQYPKRYEKQIEVDSQ